MTRAELGGEGVWRDPKAPLPRAVRGKIHDKFGYKTMTPGAQGRAGFINPEAVTALEADTLERIRKGLSGKENALAGGGAAVGALLAERLANSAINNNTAKSVAKIRKMLLGAGAGGLAAGAVTGVYD